MPAQGRPIDVAEVVAPVSEILNPLSGAAIHRAQPAQVVVSVGAALGVPELLGAAGIESVQGVQLRQRAVGVPGQRASLVKNYSASPLVRM